MGFNKFIVSVDIFRFGYINGLFNNIDNLPTSEVKSEITNFVLLINSIKHPKYVKDLLSSFKFSLKFSMLIIVYLSF
jgi:hypothetical protein